MRRFEPPADSPESWKLSFHYDKMEVYGEASRDGYSRAYRVRQRITMDLVAKYAKPPASVIDIAAAQGNFSLMLAEAGYEVTWNDLRAELAQYVEQKRSRGVIHYSPGNAFELPAQAFDLVLIAEVIEHVAHPDEFLRKAAALVKPGGHLVMSTPNGEFFRNQLPRFSDFPDTSIFESKQFRPDGDGHIFLLHQDEIRDLATKAGLELCEARLFTNPLSAGALGTWRLLPLLPEAPLRLLERASERLPLAIARRIMLGAAAVFRPRPA